MLPKLSQEIQEIMMIKLNICLFDRRRWLVKKYSKIWGKVIINKEFDSDFAYTEKLI